VARVLRGGSFNNKADNARSAARSNNNPDNRDNNVGVRVLCSSHLHPFDLFIKRELSCSGYVRYVDDFAMFADDKAVLWEWKAALKARLAALRLAIHDDSAQVLATDSGVPWLGFVVFPGYRKLKARKVRHATKRLRQRYEAYCAVEISFAEFDASVQGWLNHARFADSWGMLAEFRVEPGTAWS
jgi:hypothetical protein